MKQQLPPRDVQWFDPETGRPTEFFFDWAQSIDARTLKQPVSVADPANGDVLTYNSTTGLWEPT